jgi:hypothetical protein
MALLVAPASAKTKKPPWAGHSYSGKAKTQLDPQRLLGTATLKVSDDGKSLTYSVPWTCQGFSSTAKKKVAVKSDGSFKGGVTAHTGSPGITFFIDGNFTGKTAKSAHGDLFGAWHNFIAPNQYEEGCETGNVADPNTVFTVKR